MAVIRPTVTRDADGSELDRITSRRLSASARLLRLPRAAAAPMLFEAKCRLCPSGATGSEYGPDSLASVERWLERHLRDHHGRAVTERRLVKSGREQW